MFPRQRVVVFSDGDFWHGRLLNIRLARLARGHNASYWTKKLKRNVERDLQQTRALEAAGWTVLRYWETDVLRGPHAIADEIVTALLARNSHGRTQNMSPR